MRFKNQVVVITGGNSGIGLATAIKFRQEGAKVVIFGRTESTLKSAEEEISKVVQEKNGSETINNEILSVQGDVSELGDLDKLVKKVKDTKGFGLITHLVVNAGILKGDHITRVTEGDYDKQFEINVKGAFFTIQKFLPIFRNGGTVVLVSSVVVSEAWPNLSVYTATKAALHSMAKTLSRDLLPRRIRINTVSPGVVDTPMVTKAGVSSREKAEFSAKVPISRYGEAVEMANAIAFLSSDESHYMIGSDILLDGGISTLGPIESTLGPMGRSSRKLGYFETSCKYLRELYRGDGTVLTFAKITGPLEEKHIRTGLARLQERHSLLQAEIDDTSGTHDTFSIERFKSMSDQDKEIYVPLKTVDKRKGNVSLYVTKEITNSLFFKYKKISGDTPKYLWRFVFREDRQNGEHEALLITGHEIADALSTTHLFHELLCILSDIHRKRPVDLWNQDEIGPVEYCLNKEDSKMGELLKNGLDPNKENILHWPYEKKTKLKNRRCKVIFRKIEKKTMRALKEKGKEKGVKMNCILAAALLYTQYKTYSNRKLWKKKVGKKSVNVSEKSGISLMRTAVNLRKYFDRNLVSKEDSLNDFGAFVTTVQTSHELGNQTNVWQLAKDYEKKLEDSIEIENKKGFFPYSFDKKDVKEELAELDSKLGEFENPMISNLGVYKFDGLNSSDLKKRYAPFQLTEIYFASIQMLGDFGIGNSMITFDGDLYCCYTAIKDLMSRDTIKAIYEGFEENLIIMAGIT